MHLTMVDVKRLWMPSEDYFGVGHIGIPTRRGYDGPELATSTGVGSSADDQPTNARLTARFGAGTKSPLRDEKIIAKSVYRHVILSWPVMRASLRCRCSP